MFDEPGGPQRDNSKGSGPNNPQNFRNGQSSPGNPGPPPTPVPNDSRKSLGPSLDSPVEFRLIDPPKYWKKKKRHRPGEKKKKILPTEPVLPVPNQPDQAPATPKASGNNVTGPGP